MSAAILSALRERFGDSIAATHNYRGDETAVIAPDALIEICHFLRDESPLAMKCLMDLTCVDYLGREPRFEVVYHLYSPTLRHRVRLKAPLTDGEDPQIDSVTQLWHSADWYEREAWDLYGVRFRGHPDLRRVLLYDQFVGHPLRKDYPKERRQPLARRAPAPDEET